MITVNISDDNGTPAPLYFQYDGQCQAQRAYLEFDPSENELELTAEYTGEIGNSVPVAVWNKLLLQFRVPPQVSRTALEGLAENEEVENLLQKITDGFEEVYRNDWVGSYTDEASSAIDTIERIFETLDTVDVCTAEEYLYDSLNVVEYAQDPKNWVLSLDTDGVAIIGDLEKSARAVAEVKFDHLCYRAGTYGSVEMLPGVYLKSRESITADQEGWSDTDQSKLADFSDYEYWITTNDGQDPAGITTLDDLILELS
jgi:hypothetical protein